MLDPVGAHLEPGEILVAPSTDPGLDAAVPDRRRAGDGDGRRNSHGAVVAREYGIPAVVGVADATQLIRTGDLVTVDGAAGLVTVEAVERSAPPASRHSRIERLPLHAEGGRDG